MARPKGTSQYPSNAPIVDELEDEAESNDGPEEKNYAAYQLARSLESTLMQLEELGLSQNIFLGIPPMPSGSAMKRRGKLGRGTLEPGVSYFFSALAKNDDYQDWAQSADSRTRSYGHYLGALFYNLRRASVALLDDEPWAALEILSASVPRPSFLRYAAAGHGTRAGGKARRDYSPVLDALIAGRLSGNDQVTADRLFYDLFDDFPLPADGFVFRRDGDVLFIEQEDTGETLAQITLKSFRNRLTKIRRSS